MQDRTFTPMVPGPTGKTRRRSSVLPEGFSWLCVPIPKSVHARIRYLAGLSNMSLKEYMTWFLQTAQPAVEPEQSQVNFPVSGLSTVIGQDRSENHSSC